MDWYLPANKLIIQKGYLKKNLKKIIDNLYLNLKIKHKVFVHRDFHVSNMMFYKNKSQFINDFEILSVLRNLKIICIFTRLAKRDKKRKYLKLIPYAWKLIDNRIKSNTNFHDLKNFLQKNPRIKKYEN